MKNLVDAEAPGLIERLFLEQSQNGGEHIVYWCESNIVIDGNMKLATKVLPVAPDEVTLDDKGKRAVEYCGKKFEVHDVNGRMEAYPDLIETRGEGGNSSVPRRLATKSSTGVSLPYR